MKLRTINYSIGQGFIGAWRNRFMVLASIGVAIATLIMFGIFALATLNITHLQEQMKNNYTIQAYFKPGATAEREAKIIEELKQKEDITDITFISKEEATEIFKQRSQYIATVLSMYEDGENPLSDSMVITTASTKVNTVTNILTTYPEINPSTRNTGEEMNALLKIVGYCGIGIFVIMMIFVAISIFAISNTIKLGLYARRKEIKIMKYIGATDTFIKFPFVIEAIIIGLVAIIITFPIVAECYSWIEGYVNEGLLKMNSHSIFKLKPFWDLAWQLGACYIGAGLVISLLGSSISIKKHLEV